MSNVLKHRFVSGKADGPDPSQIQPSHWNDGHAFSGGNAGEYLARDPSDPTFGATWVGPPVIPTPPPCLVGAWEPIAFNSSYFFASGGGGSWVVDSAAVLNNRRQRIGNTVIWSLYVSWFSGTNVIGGTVTQVSII